VKCDERKPICSGCLKGSRECSYPPSPQTMDKGAVGNTLGVVEENRRHDAERALNGDDLNIDNRTQNVIVKFSSRNSSASTSSLNLFQYDQQMFIDSSRAPSDITESLYNPPNSM